MGDVDHFLGHDARARELELRDRLAGHPTHRLGRIGKGAGQMLAGRVAVVLGLHVAAGVTLDTAALDHPGCAVARQTLLDVDLGVRLGVGAGGIVDAEGRHVGIGERDLAERHAHVGMAIRRVVDLAGALDRPGRHLGQRHVTGAGDLVHRCSLVRSRANPCAVAAARGDVQVLGAHGPSAGAAHAPGRACGP